MKKVTVLLPDLRGGGVEKMRVRLATVWLDKGYLVDFLLLNAKGDLLNTVPRQARIVDLKCKRIISSIPRIISYITSEKPDVLLVAMWPLTVTSIFATLASFNKSNLKLIVSDHNTLSLSTSHKSAFYRVLLGLSVRLLYPLADRSIVVSKGVGNDLAKLSRLPKSFFKVIYNPAANEVSQSVTVPQEFIHHSKNIIAVGSLKEQKGFEILIDAMEYLIKKKEEVCLHILGEGELYNILENKIKDLKLGRYVKLVGFKENVKDYFSHSDLFVLSSKWEGFGNVIVESLNYGCPVVSTDCESGPREILEDGKHGKLVPVGDAEALAQAMYESLHEQHDTEALKRRAQDFSVAKIAQQYLDVMFPEGLDKIE